MKLLELEMIVGMTATRQVAALFAVELDIAPAEIEVLLGLADRDGAARRAHSLAGAAASLGYSELADVSLGLEADLREVAVAPLLLPELFEAARMARASIECYLAVL